MTTHHDSRPRISAFAGLLAAVAVSLGAGPAHAQTPAAEEHVDAPHGAPKKHHLRMALELGTIFAVGNRWYWRDNGKPNEVDWQLPFTTEALDAKLLSTRGWRFDGNPFDINAVGHPAFGMLTTFLARENGYGLGESFLISSLASGTWEVFLEWAEYGSLNDLAMTSPAGVPLGETAYQVIHHLRETRFELRGGLGSENGAAFAVVGGRGELDTLPAVGEGTFRGGRRVSFGIEVPTDGSVRAVDGGAKTTLAGYYRNRPDSSLLVAASAEFDYRNQSDRPEREWDLLAGVAVGPTVEYQVQHSGVTLAAGTDAYLDFAMLKPEAYAAWRTAHPQAVSRNVLEGRPQPYYYARGASLDPHVNVGYRGFQMGGRVVASLYGSLDGYDRDQEMVTNDPHLSDRDTRAEAWIGYAQGRVSVMVDGRVHHRSGEAGDAEASTGERTAMLTVGIRR